jgi:hypothetical protein
LFALARLLMFLRLVDVLDRDFFTIDGEYGALTALVLARQHDHLVAFTNLVHRTIP